jgi:hypothetical protein
MCVYVCVCMCVCAYVCVRMCVYVYMCVCFCMCTCVCVCVCVCMYVCIYVIGPFQNLLIVVNVRILRFYDAGWRQIKDFRFAKGQLNMQILLTLTDDFCFSSRLN